MTTAHELLSRATALLLDFDGPMAALMPPPANAHAADRARAALGGTPIPEMLRASKDHLAVLRWALEEVPGKALDVERSCANAELEAAQVCEPSVHAGDLVAFAGNRQVPIAVVSNNADAAVREFMTRHGWDSQIEAYACRTPEKVDWLKPKPNLLQFAADVLQIDISGAVFIGDAVTDVIAGKAAGCRIVGIAKNTHRFEELADAGANSVVMLGDRAGLVPT
jgi:beta-phosphoglucomutase-like phosphatase (HAD superfamily)